MDKNGFRAYLQERKISDEEIDASIQLVERFEKFTQDSDIPGRDDLLNFSAELIEAGDNTVANYYALARYAYFTENHEIYITAVDLLDGAEVMDNLYQKAEITLGKERRDSIFEEIELPQLGLPNQEKVKVTKTVISRLVEIADPQECEQILADSLRDLDEAWYRDEVKLYQECTSLDEFLDKNAQNFIALLEKLRDEGKPFFTQFIADQVVEYVRNEPLIARGLREGDILYEVKIPHQTSEFLAATDEANKRYHYCHCPWVKESLKDGDSNISPKFCKCSSGFHKKRWEAILGEPLKAEIIESVLQGDQWCKIAIHLPEGIP
jgi:hypothetical protein